MTTSAHSRANALEALKYALDANVVLTQIRASERFDEVKKRRDKALDEFLDETLLAAQLAVEEAARR